MSWYGAVPTSALPANASDVDVRISTPDVWAMQLIWAVWTVAALVDLFFTGTLLVVVLSSPKVRQLAFNLYLAALVVPDFVSSGGFIVSNILNMAHQEYVSAAMCRWQSFYATFAIAGSFWVNALVAFELYRLLAATKRLQHYVPTRPRVAATRCLVVYTLAAFISAMPKLGMVPVYPRAVRGLVCLPAPTSEAEEPFFLLVYVQLLCGIPLTVSLSIAFTSWWTGLIRFGKSAREQSARERGVHSLGAMPDTASIRRARRARALNIYFLRLFGACLLWIPGLGIFGYSQRSAIPVALAITWMSMIGVVAVPLSFAKQDVRDALVDLLPCRNCRRAARVACATLASDNAEPVATDDEPLA